MDSGVGSIPTWANHQVNELTGQWVMRREWAVSQVHLVKMIVLMGSGGPSPFGQNDWVSGLGP